MQVAIIRKFSVLMCLNVIYLWQVTMAFSDDIVEPGDPVSMTTSTTPNSVVLLSVVDKSLTLLAEACKSLEKENVS